MCNFLKLDSTVSVCVFVGVLKMTFSIGFNKITNLIWVSLSLSLTKGALGVTSYPDSILEIRERAT